MKLKGIDVSVYQGDIDWKSVKESGIDFAIIRCGYGSDIESQDDVKFGKNVEACISYEIPFGVYLFSYANTMEKAESEAKHVLRLVEKYKEHISYPVFYDLEDDKTTRKCGKIKIGDIAEKFCDIIEKNGLYPAIYANKNWFKSVLTDARFAKWDKWVAQYYEKCTYNGNYTMWQHTSSGNISGINGRVDLNYCYVDYPSRIKAKESNDNGSENQIEESEENSMTPVFCYSKSKNGAEKLSENFKVSEFACKDGSDVVVIAPELVTILQAIRSHFGRAVIINSAYRTPTYNKKVGGATYSQHQYGTAADISVSGVAPKQVAEFAEKLLYNRGGIGIYNDFTHIDVREVKSRWNG